VKNSAKGSGDPADEINPELTRGVRNPRVIDLIYADDTHVTLQIVEERGWSSAEKQFEQFQEKFNNYLDYVYDGFLRQQYPQYQSLKPRFEFICPPEPPINFRELFEAIERYVKSVGAEFAISYR
jgi:hypothetical protein